MGILQELTDYCEYLEKRQRTLCQAAAQLRVVVHVLSEALDCYSEASINKLCTQKLVKYDTDISLQINSSIVSEKEKLEALPDHFQDLKRWWFSKKWAVIFTVIFLVLPALKTYIDLVGLVLK